MAIGLITLEIHITRTRNLSKTSGRLYVASKIGWRAHYRRGGGGTRISGLMAEVQGSAS